VPLPAKAAIATMARVIHSCAGGVHHPEVPVVMAGGLAAAVPPVARLNTPPPAPSSTHEAVVSRREARSARLAPGPAMNQPPHNAGRPELRSRSAAVPRTRTSTLSAIGCMYRPIPARPEVSVLVLR
jgi:hypothetical protein